MDAAGHLKLADRKKDMIVVSGFKVELRDSMRPDAAASEAERSAVRN
jgi:acyl-CoA synthetase (AMP-forming)/AMP-acid ligase II